MISYFKIVLNCLDAAEERFLALVTAQKTYPALTAGCLPSLCCGSWTFPVPFLAVSHTVRVLCNAALSYWCSSTEGHVCAAHQIPLSDSVSQHLAAGLGMPC